MHGSGNIPDDILTDIHFFRYRERFQLSYQEAINEPAEEVARAFLIWSKEAEHDKLEANRNAKRSK